MKLPTLYKAAKKGENVQWSIKTGGESYIENYGRVGGKMQENVHQCYATNVGRTNERSAREQAELEAKAKWQSKVDKGYRETQDEVDDVPLLPMLASKFQERKGKFSYPVYVQPKLDGVRCIAKPDGTLISRGGKPYIVPHISEQVKKLKLKFPIDGELYIHGVPLQSVTSYVKKNHGDGTTEQLNLVVYDAVMDLTFPRRLQYLIDTFENVFQTADNGQVVRLFTTIVKSEEEVLEAEQKLVANGYEGAIVRTMDLSYEANHRSNNLMKVKTFEDDEFKVIGAKQSAVGGVIWTCITKDGKEFDSNPKCPTKEKQWYWKHKDEFIGKLLTVRFKGYTPDGKPYINVGKGFRDEKDLQS